MKALFKRWYSMYRTAWSDYYAFYEEYGYGQEYLWGLLSDLQQEIISYCLPKETEEKLLAYFKY